MAQQWAHPRFRWRTRAWRPRGRRCCAGWCGGRRPAQCRCPGRCGAPRGAGPVLPPALPESATRCQHDRVRAAFGFKTFKAHYLSIVHRTLARNVCLTLTRNRRLGQAGNVPTSSFVFRFYHIHTCKNVSVSPMHDQLWGVRASAGVTSVRRREGRRGAHRVQAKYG